MPNMVSNKVEATWITLLEAWNDCWNRSRFAASSSRFTPDIDCYEVRALAAIESCAIAATFMSRAALPIALVSSP